MTPQRLHLISITPEIAAGAALKSSAPHPAHLIDSFT
jgi:hypothetical protein